MSPLLGGALQYVPHYKASDRTGDRKEQHGEPEISAYEEAEVIGSTNDHRPNHCNDNPTADVCSNA